MRVCLSLSRPTTKRCWSILFDVITSTSSGCSLRGEYNKGELLHFFQRFEFLDLIWIPPFSLFSYPSKRRKIKLISQEAHSCGQRAACDAVLVYLLRRFTHHVRAAFLQVLEGQPRLILRGKEFSFTGRYCFCFLLEFFWKILFLHSKFAPQGWKQTTMRV